MVRPADPADVADVTAAERTRVTYAGGRLTVKAGEALGVTVIGNGGGNVTVDRAEEGLRVAVEQGTVTVGALARARRSGCRRRDDQRRGPGWHRRTTPRSAGSATTWATPPEAADGNPVELHAHVARGDILLHRVTG